MDDDISSLGCNEEHYRSALGLEGYQRGVLQTATLLRALLKLMHHTLRFPCSCQSVLDKVADTEA